ncbi:hypothetical protein LOB78_08030 [Lactobacillus delbrueckii subsp. lactis]|uniref:hypothetical protein n=1 Tax=Lactobacillus delbrueckii TaxID=1584 RepID=UPI00054D188E|nr:hypothetical protein [Lactobacillus delbrueckii]MCD5444721.1 hypothetical protein [Lactobacillus delbrueckii subsp. lactis]MCD5509079.1 hypothetical protein [Lactobacillus delbrueckii subsp. lactis]MCD5510917.1 hypothetical protein [Lactobacillus delbrueckii subsp. lactis]MCD5512767.1 hypothetical protein [Lactobacillus delbrueckii subsp. lactis]
MMHLLSKVKTEWIFCGFYKVSINDIIGSFLPASKAKGLKICKKALAIARASCHRDGGLCVVKK